MLFVQTPTINVQMSILAASTLMVAIVAVLHLMPFAANLGFIAVPMDTIAVNLILPSAVPMDTAVIRTYVRIQVLCLDGSKVFFNSTVFILQWIRLVPIM